MVSAPWKVFGEHTLCMTSQSLPQPSLSDLIFSSPPSPTPNAPSSWILETFTWITHGKSTLSYGIFPAKLSPKKERALLLPGLFDVHSWFHSQLVVLVLLIRLYLQSVWVSDLTRPIFYRSSKSQFWFPRSQELDGSPNWILEPSFRGLPPKSQYSKAHQSWTTRHSQALSWWRPSKQNDLAN